MFQEKMKMFGENLHRLWSEGCKTVW